MVITDRIVYDMMTILEDGQVQLRRARVIMDDGTEIHRQFHRQVLEPGQDVTMFPSRVQAVCQTLWTPQVIADYQAAKERNRLVR